MLIPLSFAAIVLLLVSAATAVLLFRDVTAARLRERVSAIHSNAAERTPATLVRTLAIRSAVQHGERAAKVMRLLRLNPGISYQNIVAWRLVIVISCGLALAGFMYERSFLGAPLAALAMPIEALFLARFIFGWERARFQKAILEQIPDVMALICRAAAAGIPLSEALRSVAKDAPAPSRDEFLLVTNQIAIGQPVEGALWKLYERVGLPEYAFFAVTIGLQAQTGGSLVETLQNLQDLVRKRVALSKRGKALAAEARMSAIILGVLPFVVGAILAIMMPGFLEFFFHDPTGNHLLLVAVGLMSTGIFAMRQLIRRSLAP